MKLILLSGGSGKRLWPMSNDSRSKQFLKVLECADGTPESMVQRVWRQLGSVGLQQNTYVCAAKAQYDIISSQLGDIPLIEEPTRRDTFPAIALASMYLADMAGCPDDEPLVVLPVDHFVDASYFQIAASLAQILQDGVVNLALLGVKPTFPTSKFGYICTDSALAVNGFTGGLGVSSFVEKPDVQAAESLIRDGALWNCGVFCFRLGFVRRHLAARNYPTDYARLRDSFEDLPKRSFDYEVVEKESRIAVLPYGGVWKDLGTWGTLSEEMTNNFVGRGNSRNCVNTHVVNELGIPLITLGLTDTMVVATPDGVLIADKEASSGLKDVVEPFSGRPMFEERRWGSYRVLDHQKLADGTEALTKCLVICSNHNISYQQHQKRTEVWTILQGSGQLALDGNIERVGPGDVVQIQSGQWHGIYANETLTIIEVQTGQALIEEDIIRKYTDWADIEKHCRP